MAEKRGMRNAGSERRRIGAAARVSPAKRALSHSHADTAADILLRLDTTSSEAVVQDSIARWLDENLLKYSPQYRTPAGTVDIWRGPP